MCVEEKGDLNQDEQHSGITQDFIHLKFSDGFKSCTSVYYSELERNEDRAQRSQVRVRHELKVESSTDISCTGACNISELDQMTLKPSPIWTFFVSTSCSFQSCNSENQPQPL